MPKRPSCSGNTQEKTQSLDMQKQAYKQLKKEFKAMQNEQR